jgi:hypothetical protein
MEFLNGPSRIKNGQKHFCGVQKIVKKVIFFYTGLFTGQKRFCPVPENYMWTNFCFVQDQLFLSGARTGHKKLSSEKKLSVFYTGNFLYNNLCCTPTPHMGFLCDTTEPIK